MPLSRDGTPSLGSAHSDTRSEDHASEWKEELGARAQIEEPVLDMLPNPIANRPKSIARGRGSATVNVAAAAQGTGLDRHDGASQEEQTCNERVHPKRVRDAPVPPEANPDLNIEASPSRSAPANLQKKRKASERDSIAQKKAKKGRKATKKTAERTPNNKVSAQPPASRRKPTAAEVANKVTTTSSGRWVVLTTHTRLELIWHRHSLSRPRPRDDDYS